MTPYSFHFQRKADAATKKQRYYQVIRWLNVIWDLDNHPLKYRRYPDGCYAVVLGNRRGPCAYSRVEARRRFRRSGLIQFARIGA
jgi:hypothetical protein